MQAGLRDLLLMNEIHWKWQCGKAKKGTDPSSWSFFLGTQLPCLENIQTTQCRISHHNELRPPTNSHVNHLGSGFSVPERSSLQKIIWWSEDEDDDPEDDSEDDPGGPHHCNFMSDPEPEPFNSAVPRFLIHRSTWDNRLTVFKPASVRVLHFAAVYK